MNKNRFIYLIKRDGRYNNGVIFLIDVRSEGMEEKVGERREMEKTYYNIICGYFVWQ